MNKFFAIILYSIFAQCALANEYCPALKANKIGSSGPYVFKQHMFENTQDLVIVDPQAEVKRVTFARGIKAGSTDTSVSCFFRPLAFVQGGDWGWHMLWQEGDENSKTQGLFYARMDGEAWVSSSPKRLTKLAPINVQFKLNNQNIAVTWQQVEDGVTTNMQAVSYDEGRTWDLMSE